MRKTQYDRPLQIDRKIPSQEGASTRGGYGGATGYSCLCGKYIASWNYLSAEQYFLELRAVRAILSGYFRGRKNTTWNFMRLAQYNRPLRLASLGKSALPLVARTARGSFLAEIKSLALLPAKAWHW